MKFITLNQVAPWTDDFFFLQCSDDERLVICNPQDSICRAPCYLRSHKTLDDHIRLVQERQLKKVMVVAEDIGFLRQCPSLEDVSVYPSFHADGFDFSPLYDLPNLRRLYCETTYGPEDDRVSSVDYSKFSALENVIISGPKGHKNVHLLKGIKYLAFEDKQPVNKSLVGAFDGEELEELVITSSPLRSLKGLGQAQKLRKLRLSHNRYLEDIGDLIEVKNTITELEIENCGRIKDFSVLSHLQKVEWIRMVGSNVLPNLSFVRNMSRLHAFMFFMDVADGDLSMCLRIPYVSIRDRRHYSHKDKDFSKLYDP